MNRKLLFVVSFIVLSFSSNAQNVTIPDPTFKAYLLSNTFLNSDADKDNISYTEAAKLKGMQLAANGMNSLIGIEAFVNLTSYW